MLEQEYRTLYNSASAVKNWQTMNKNDLINAYIDNENDETLRNAYFSAIMCRYWGNIGKYYTASKASGFTIEDCYSWLVEAIMIGLKYRAWRDPNNPLSKDKNAPDKVINRCIFSRRRYYYYIANLKKNKGEYNKISLDNDKINIDVNKYLIDYTYTYNNLKDSFYVAVQEFFRDKEYTKGIIFYTLITNIDECINNNKINVNNVIKVIKSMDYACLSKELNLNKNALLATNEIKNLEQSTLLKIIKKVLISFSKDERLKKIYAIRYF